MTQYAQITGPTPEGNQYTFEITGAHTDEWFGLGSRVKVGERAFVVTAVEWVNKVTRRVHATAEMFGNRCTHIIVDELYRPTLRDRMQQAAERSEFLGSLRRKRGGF